MITRTDAIDDALDRLADYRYLDGHGFAFHGPMGAETLSTLGHHDLVAGWVEDYKERNGVLDAPPAGERIDADDETSWRPALGDYARASDWAALFGAQLADRAWPQVVGEWVPRMLAGYGGGLTHGLIRVAHGVRALPVERPPSDLMLAELAHGLAYWAATFTALPGRPRLRGSIGLDEAIAGLPRPEPAWTPIEAGTFARLGELPDFPHAVDALARPDSPDEALSDLTAASCRVMLANPDVFPVGPIHAVTPVAAARVLLPHIPDLSVETLYAQLWQVDAAIITGFTARGGAEPPYDHADPPALAEVLARAVEHRDTHVLKFAEACAREHARRPDPVYLRSAHHVVDVVPRW